MDLKQAFFILRHGSAEGMAKYLEAIKTIEDNCIPVVRCRDCKWYQKSEKLSPNKFCFRLQHPTENRKVGYNFSDDDFCSNGERKDGEA